MKHQSAFACLGLTTLLACSAQPQAKPVEPVSMPAPRPTPTLASPRPAEPPAYEAPLTNEDIVKLSRAGLSAGAIATKIKLAPSEAFDVSPDAMIDLRQEKVSSIVIQAMIERTATRAPNHAPLSAATR